MSDTMRLSFKEVYCRVSEYLAMGSIPTGNDLEKCKKIVLRGYRKFLSPIDLSNGLTYSWSFLQKTTTLSTETGIDTYKLPIGFAHLVLPFTHTTPVSYNPTQKPLEFVYLQKSQTTGSGYPRYFALKTGNYDTLTGQQTEVVFAPIPSATLTYYYTYNISPISPVEDEDVFMSGDFGSECILEISLAVAELQENNTIGVHSQEAEKLLQSCIGNDKKINLCRDLGSMNGKISDGYVRSSMIYLDGTQVLPGL